MHVFLRYSRGGRYIAGVILLFAMLAATVGMPWAAGTTGTISGTITDAQTKKPLPGVQVGAASPTGHYETRTDARGFFVLNGVNPDTYTVSLELGGFEAQRLTAVNVFANQSIDVSTSLGKSLTTIGRVSAHSVGGAFQPTLPQDTYTVTSDQINTALGKNFNTSETQLLQSLPGVTLDSSGYPVLRGGRENDEGFQFDGIDFTDPFTNQFINTLSLNQPGELQLTPGAGNATQGNSGTGVINILPKRGTYPAFGDASFEIDTLPYYRKIGAEYGVATSNGRFSDYISYVGTRDSPQYGAFGVPTAQISAGTFFTTSYTVTDNLQNNFLYKFGRNNNQSLQILTVNQNNIFYQNRGGTSGLFYKTNDPYVLDTVTSNLPLTVSQFQTVVGLLPYQTSATEPLNRQSSYNQPNAVFKAQYSNNLNASTYFNVRYYRTNAVTTFDFPFFTQDAFPFAERTFEQGGFRTGYAGDLTTQLGSKNLLQFGTKFEYLDPNFTYDDPIDGVFLTSGFGNGLDVLSFLPNNNCPVPGSCGYLSKYFAGGVPKVPAFTTSPIVRRQDFSFYVDDTFTPTDKLKIDAGLRVDKSHLVFPPVSSGLYADGTTSIPSDAQDPTIPEPRLAASFQIGKNDAIRASYGRSVEMPFISEVDDYIGRQNFNAFNAVPSYDAYGALLAGAAPGTAFPAMWCGVNGIQKCKNFGDQLFWNYQNNFGGIPVEPAKPTTFNNYDFSFSHQFPNNVAFKVTPFYRRGYDVIALAASLKLVNGQEVIGANGQPATNPTVTTNLGVNRTTGVEFLLTKEAQYGLSGQVSATYLNETSNVIPLSSGEDFFPSIPPASLALGNEYRVGFVSPFQATAAAQYKFHNGLRINPIIYYYRGYPYNPGTLTPVYVNGVPANVPNTNVTSSAGASGSGQYVDPQNPGSQYKPNIAATRGTPDSPSAGGLLTGGQVYTDLTIEYAPRGTHSTFGVQFTNLFNNLYSLNDSVIPALNPRYQPVATGIAGVKTGTSSLATLYPQDGFAQYSAARFGASPYIIDPTGTPFEARLYYQISL